MAARARYFDVQLTYSRNGGWTGSDPFIVAVLNTATPRLARTYLPDFISAQEILAAALPSGGWEIIDYDPEEPRGPGETD